MQKNHLQISFDKERHVYIVDGVVYPSVTTIINHCVRQFQAVGMDFYAKRGEIVHNACELLDNDNLAKYNEDAIFANYLECYKKFKQLYGAVVIENEVKVYSKTFGYCGTVDKIVRIGDKVGIVDLKTSACIGDIAGIQISAYAHAVVECKRLDSVDFLYVVQLLRIPGRYPVVYDFTQKRNVLFGKFLDMLNKYKEEKGGAYVTEKE